MMKFLLAIVLVLKFRLIFTIEPVLIVHGGAGSVAANRVIKLVYRLKKMSLKKSF